MSKDQNTEAVCSIVMQLKESLLRHEERIMHHQGDSKHKRHPNISDDDYHQQIESETLNSLIQLNELSSTLSITVDVLSKTMIGKVVSRIRKSTSPNIAHQAKSLVRRWKQMVKDTKTQHDDNEAVSGKRKQLTSDELPTAKRRKMKASVTNNKAVVTRVVNVKVAHIRPLYKNLEEWMQASTCNVYIGRRGVVFVNGKRFPTEDRPWCNPFKIGKTTVKSGSQKNRRCLEKMSFDSMKDIFEKSSARTRHWEIRS